MPITGEHRALAEGRLPRLRAGVYGQTAAWALEGVATDTRPVYPKSGGPEARPHKASASERVCHHRGEAYLVIDTIRGRIPYLGTLCPKRNTSVTDRVSDIPLHF